MTLQKAGAWPVANVLYNSKVNKTWKELPSISRRINKEQASTKSKGAPDALAEAKHWNKTNDINYQTIFKSCSWENEHVHCLSRARFYYGVTQGIRFEILQ